MNLDQRQKVMALKGLGLPDIAWGMGSIKNFVWRLSHQPGKPLSATERFRLDELVYHYRAKLGGTVPFEVPTVRPEPADYYPSAKEPVQGALL